MGKKSRDKGYRGEKEVEHLHPTHGLQACRMPLSGAVAGFEGDLLIEELFKGEVKWRAKGWPGIERWLGKNDFLFLRKDGEREPLVVMSFKMYARMLRVLISEEEAFETTE